MAGGTFSGDKAVPAATASAAVICACFNFRFFRFSQEDVWACAAPSATRRETTTGPPQAKLVFICDRLLGPVPPIAFGCRRSLLPLARHDRCTQRSFSSRRPI